jgi:hypothetical protein
MQTRSKTSIASAVVIRSFNPEPRSPILIPEKNPDDLAYVESSRKRFTPNYCDKLRHRNSPPLRSGELAHKLRSSNSVSRLKKIYDVDIDFDEASKAWLQNKKRTGDGCYTYTS